MIDPPNDQPVLHDVENDPRQEGGGMQMNLQGQFEKRPVHPRGIQREPEDHRDGDRYRHAEEEATLARDDSPLRRPYTI
ncbi:hypothetical protein NHF48_011505 [Sphingomonas sp. H160509]|uniref:hypothetical protein n=1 Tax=Sphingomonas sp. H160509 TaxID=2955313 RepID=UPI002097EFEA|nr:hypothetical protein [Sphingomonas sp. H160509]MDD1451456.1 hypothetical protein [Sphingomonas sp. H160509]